MDKVFQELTRHVFALFESGPLADPCANLSNELPREFSQTTQMRYPFDSVVDDFAEAASDDI